MFEDIKLDDRSFDEIREEAISHIVDHCPEWTNHNASDPGITLVELFAYMTEMTQYKLNRVPQKNYLAFLDLLGIKQRLPVPGKSRVQFELSTGYQIDASAKNTVFIKAGSSLSSEGDDENEALSYETSQDLYASNAKLVNLYAKSFDEARQKSKILDYSQNIELTKPFYPFSSDGKSDNRAEIYLYCDDFSALQNDVKMTILFRLPTSMREHKVSENFLQMMRWEFYDGQDWQKLYIAHDLSVAVDDADADVLAVTFEGNVATFEKGSLSQFSPNEQFYVRACLIETPLWLSEFCSYEVSVITNSPQSGALPQSCYHNYEQLDMNNNFYPFGSHPGLEDSMLDELFYLRCDPAFSKEESFVSIEFVHSQNSAYSMPKGKDNLQLIWEYAIDEGKWSQLDVKDQTAGFTQQGSVSFSVPANFANVMINSEEGYWIRSKIVNGNYGQAEKSEFDHASGAVKVSQSTLTPPVFSTIRVKYSLPRKDIDDCYAFNNYKYERVVFEKNKPVYFFKQDAEYEEALYFGFDSYLSEQELSVYFDLQNFGDLNLLKGQRTLQWELLKGGQWQKLEVEDGTHGLSVSADVKISLPIIESLEAYTLYIDSYERMWIKVSVIFNAMKQYPRVNAVLLNTVEVRQQETFYDELIGYSDGLPDMRYSLDKKNLSSMPKIMIADEEYTPVERFIDYSKDDKIFRCNAINGELEFGDGVYGKVPPLGAEIIVKEYSITKGKKGNLPIGKINILQAAINYIDSIKNITPSVNAQDGDTIEELKRFAPSVLKTMKRAVSADDYEHLSRQYSTFVKRAKCVLREGEIIILIMAQNVLEEKGFINPGFLRELQRHLESLSMITVKPQVESVLVTNLNVKLKLKYSNEEHRPSRNLLENELLQKCKAYFNPFTGFKGEGFSIGKRVSKNDFQSIVSSLEESYSISQLTLLKDGAKASQTGVEVFYNEIIYVNDIVIEELSYDF